MKPKTHKTGLSLFYHQNFAYYSFKIKFLRKIQPLVLTNLSKRRAFHSKINKISTKFTFKSFIFKFLPKTIGIFVLIWILKYVGTQKTLSLFKSINFFVFILILLLNFPHIMLKTQRWRLILLKNKEKYPFLNALRAYFSGIAAGIATPGRSGEFVRAIYPSNEVNTPFYLSLASVFADRFYDLFFLLGISFLSFYLIFSLKIFGMLVLWVIISVLLLYKFRYFLQDLFIKSISKFGFGKQKTKLFMSSFTKSFTSPFEPLALSAGGYSIMVIQLFILAKMMGISIEIGELFLIFAAANTFALLPVSISGLGTREAAFGFLFAHIGYSVQDGVSLSLMFFISVSIPVTLIGLITLFIPFKQSKTQIIK